MQKPVSTAGPEKLAEAGVALGARPAGSSGQAILGRCRLRRATDTRRFRSVDFVPLHALGRPHIGLWVEADLLRAGQAETHAANAAEGLSRGPGDVSVEFGLCHDELDS
jgi:hypothetical protein